MLCELGFLNLAGKVMAEPGRSSSPPPYEPYPARARLLPLKAEAEKDKGNAAYFELNFVEATKQYTRALRRAPNSALLYANRCASLQQGRANLHHMLDMPLSQTPSVQ